MKLWWALRSALFVVWMVVTVVPWALMMVALSMFIRGKRLYWPTMRWLRMAVWGARVICGVKYRVHGLQHLPTAADALGAVVLAAKHQSTWETFAFPTLMPHPLAYVFKRELLYVPFFGWAIGLLDMIHIDRSLRTQAFKKVVAQGKERLAQGIWIIMFPEGTRIARGQKGVYETSGTRLAVQTGAPVIPIAVTSAKCWPRKAFIKTPGTIDVSIGKPIPSEGRHHKELMQEVEDWIEAEMRRLDPEAYQ